MSDLVRMNKSHSYAVSTDYMRLWDLALVTPVVCIVDYEDCRDVACTLYGCGALQVGARGIGYIWAETQEEFLSQCATLNLEWIPPREAL